MIYEKLLIDADKQNFIVREKNIPGYDGRIKKRIAIHKDIPQKTEKACVLAEELGHHHTTYGDIIGQTKVEDRKQELRARLWGYNKLIGLQGIIKAYNHGCKCLYDMAEFLDVTEEFLKEALQCYQSKYGTYAVSGNYIICFDPGLAIIEVKESAKRFYLFIYMNQNIWYNIENYT